MGLSPYQSQNEILAKMIDARAGKEAPPWPQNMRMRFGDLLEPIVLTEAARILELRNVELDYRSAAFHEVLPLAASLDGTGVGTGSVRTDTERGIYCVNADEIEIDGIGILEAKTTQAAPEDVPPPYRGPLQLQAQMMCTGHQWGAVCVLYRGSDLRVFVYRSNPEVQRRIADAVVEFDRRASDIDWYPSISSMDANVAYARVDQGAPEIDLTGMEPALELAEKLVHAKQQKRLAEAIIDEAEAGLKDIMGCHESAYAPVGNRRFIIKWPMRHLKGSPEKVVPAKPPSVVRQQTLSIKELDK